MSFESGQSSCSVACRYYVHKRRAAAAGKTNVVCNASRADADAAHHVDIRTTYVKHFIFLLFICRGLASSLSRRIDNIPLIFTTTPARNHHSNLRVGHLYLHATPNFLNGYAKYHYQSIWPRAIRNFGNKVTDPSSAPKVLTYVEKIVKIGLVYPEIFD